MARTRVPLLVKLCSLGEAVGQLRLPEVLELLLELPAAELVAVLGVESSCRGPEARGETQQEFVWEWGSLSD